MATKTGSQIERGDLVRNERGEWVLVSVIQHFGLRPETHEVCLADDEGRLVWVRPDEQVEVR